MQLDNRLLPVLHSKLERLALECLKDEMKLPCKRGQKWYCESDGGRWRKHKCKSMVQTTIPLPADRAFRKCACFTPNGLVYKKLPVSINQARVLSLDSQLMVGFYIECLNKSSC